MKTFLLLMTSIPALVFGQLKGEFCHNYGFGAECLTFYENNTFEYSHSHCTGDARGKGIYTLRRNKLMLQFQADTPTNPENIFVINEELTSEDTLDIEVTVLDSENKEPIPFVTVFITGSTGNLICGTYTDIYGYCKLKVQRHMIYPIIHFKYVGYNQLSNVIPIDSNSQFTIYLNSDYDYISNKTITYKIKNIKKRRISLKKNYKGARFINYDKK